MACCQGWQRRQPQQQQPSCGCPEHHAGRGVHGHLFHGLCPAVWCVLQVHRPSPCHSTQRQRQPEAHVWHDTQLAVPCKQRPRASGQLQQQQGAVSRRCAARHRCDKEAWGPGQEHPPASLLVENGNCQILQWPVHAGVCLLPYSSSHGSAAHCRPNTKFRQQQQWQQVGSAGILLDSSMRFRACESSLAKCPGADDALTAGSSACRLVHSAHPLVEWGVSVSVLLCQDVPGRSPHGSK